MRIHFSQLGKLWKLKFLILSYEVLCSYQYCSWLSSQQNHSTFLWFLPGRIFEHAKISKGKYRQIVMLGFYLSILHERGTFTAWQVDPLNSHLENWNYGMIYPENYFFFFPPKNDITWFVIICKLFFVNNAYKLILFAKSVLSFKLAMVLTRQWFIKNPKSWKM